MNYVIAQMCQDFIEMIDNKKMNARYYTVQRNITHSKEFAGNQGKHQN